jgi:hypothetical protein
MRPLTVDIARREEQEVSAKMVDLERGAAREERLVHTDPEP